MATFALTSGGYGVIGSHARLRIWCREAWGFESLYPHCTSDLFGSLVSFDKGTRSACCASADLSAYLGVILLRNQLRRVIVRLNKFHRSITPHSTLRVIPPISSVCSRLLPPFESHCVFEILCRRSSPSTESFTFCGGRSSLVDASSMVCQYTQKNRGPPLGSPLFVFGD